MISILACAAGELINNDPAGQIFDDNLLVHIGIGLVESPGGLLQQAVRLLALPHRVRIPGRLQGQWRILNKSKGLSIINNLYAGKKKVRFRFKRVKMLITAPTAVHYLTIGIWKKIIKKCYEFFFFNAKLSPETFICCGLRIHIHFLRIRIRLLF